jgi:hypothetical protein
MPRGCSKPIEPPEIFPKRRAATKISLLIRMAAWFPSSSRALARRTIAKAKRSWREAKISLAHAKGSQTQVYAGMIEGGVEKAGQQLFECAVQAGFGVNSPVHAIGDGAPWIVGQVEEQFGNLASRAPTRSIFITFAST